MNIRLMKVIPMAAALLAIACPAARANLLTNGGFQLSDNGYSEYLTPEGWTSVGLADGVIADSVFGTPSYNGFTYFFDTGGYSEPTPNAGDGIEQTVATSAGSQYTLSFGEANENVPGSGPEWLDVLVNGTSIASIPMEYDSTYGELELPWTTEVLNFTADSSSSTIAFEVTGDSLGFQDPIIAGVDLEGGSPSPAPEPATWASLGTALVMIVGVGVWRRQSLGTMA